MAKRAAGMTGMAKMIEHKHKMFKFCSIGVLIIGLIWSLQDLGFISTYNITFWPGAFLILGLVGLLGGSIK